MNRPEMKERFDYGRYLESTQEPEKVKRHLAGFVPMFEDCKRVLDLGCGPGHFLRLLKDAGIDAVGVDADPLTVRQAEDSGLRVVQADVLPFLLESTDVFDGVFCSHLVEHLPFGALVELVEGIAQRLMPGGALVMAFPNPESLEMQLFHFWVDPQHVRLYHPTLIKAMLSHYGFQVDDCTFRNWRMGGDWVSSNGASHAGNTGRGALVSKIARRLKGILGVTKLETEVDYLTRLRSIGEEAVIVARKKA
jgi:SAM-dependent methyltransferase